MIGYPVAFVLGLAVAATPPSTWTPDYTARLLTYAQPPAMPFPLSEADIAAAKECFVRRYTASFPGGPRQAAEAGPERVREVAANAGKACAQETGTRIVESETWTPQFTAFFVYGCTLGGGQAMTAHCECMVKEAPKYFRKPAAFWSVMKRSGPEGISPEDKTVRRIATVTCARFLPKTSE